MGTQVGSAAETGVRKGGDDWEERVYTVVWSDETWNTADIRYASGIPSYGQTLASDRPMVCINKSVAGVEDKPTWAVITCRWQTPDFSFSSGRPMPRLNSTYNFWSIVKTITPSGIEEPITQDANGKICANIVGEPITPPIMDRTFDYQTEIRFLTNHTSYSATMAGLLNSWNSDAFTLTIGGRNWAYPVGGTRLDSFTISDATDENGSVCESITLVLLSRSTGNVESRPNLSLNHFEGGTSGTLTRNTVIENGINVPAPEPWFLDASGAKIEQGEAIVMNDFTIGSTASFAGMINPIKGSGS